MTRLICTLTSCLFCVTSMAADLSAEVKGVISGDTLTATVSGKTRTIRLKYIECAPPEEALGAQAKQMTEQVCLGKTVRLQIVEDREVEGLYGEIAPAEGKTLSVRLLEAGLARLKDPANVPDPLRKAFL